MSFSAPTCGVYLSVPLRGVMADEMMSSIIAPTTEASSVPNVPVGTHPHTPTSQAPRNPPSMPTIIFITSPEPLPLTITLAIHPAIRPMSKYHNQNIIYEFILFTVWDAKFVPTRVWDICMAFSGLILLQKRVLLINKS